MRILLVAQCRSTSQALKNLKGSLKARGIFLECILGNGSYPRGVDDEAVKKAVYRSDFVLIGMSDTPYAPLLPVRAALWAKSRNTPFGFYCDHPSEVLRAKPGKWFGEFRRNASLVAGAVTSEARNIFPNAILVRVGQLRKILPVPAHKKSAVRENSPKSRLIRRVAYAIKNIS